MNKIKMEQKNISYKSLIHQNQTILSSATVIISVQKSTNEREHLRVVYVSHVNSSVSKEFIYNASEDENNKTQWIPLI
ncbi:MAG: hypothetical protein LKJ07_04280 [Leuconostoc mesenteroides]|jgi:hypothetical protein|uniref:hypothetical protein n=2 Tax=Leuconostoc mesenteroides TaxID=1245 RepID=UPI00046CA263|nr:hypothetical protein [Leuconostoc mesenteroides]MBC9722984.1 hypothetical protein [Lactobacillus sp.]APE76844.1 hypothetical protein ARA02_05695 [Leuconostoc mesenteroides subsp. jonggajibkimchii]ASR67982.1 hypothetical protein CBW60_00700 [Leuconostoc mesenteroides]MBA5973002.1 hypothetical protein [Leuconostoc mesenteroides]MBU7546832.1 hypothetical protein [Leuconostoc mesenteroides]